MIQFNLLPDIKLAYIRAARTKRIFLSISVIITVVVLFVVGLIATSVLVFQRQHISNLDNDIAAKTKELTETQDIDKILTVQNQLNVLPGLHERKPDVTRLYEYIRQVTPASVTLTDLDIDFIENTMLISGKSLLLADINKYVDTLKFTRYFESFPIVDDILQESSDPVPAFSSVVLQEFDKKDGDQFEYSISLIFDPVIFENSRDITLSVPNQISTRSEVEKPVFDAIRRDNNAE